ncbi:MULTISPECIES: hypothetical protein [unclassified Paenibacillus]|uniref:hypothetical protein n=1 Tax=unclassified Paenibacillus TaxID=185978 RepID=UPI0024058CD2|nr:MULTISPECIES: hypothetical protein [unclassified Paenibacillus]MDF9842180.1 hypothetical protein [Paenibacillus sp. PastF-2]MDF9848567.1 hypothetical protein [Paenibacillus sp. PastM-2]MDF9855136.1 hypothetical protein [Paenibacillus sp. PastF-1]MDH6480405.1 hypothetical protein [Paenibacillus sp. PastH-2]MDH6507835.1 hypothetical protein [Paenibacillus sp. PastM-3]
MNSAERTDNKISRIRREHRAGTGRRPVIALAGAERYTDHNLLALLTEHCDLIVLADNGDVYQDQTNLCPQVQQRPCDLFSLPSATAALQGADYAIYLVPPVMSQARLTQASFADMAAIQADIFARAACINGIRHIVCLSGPASRNIPPGQCSRHLHSSLEAEQILRSCGLPVTVLRTGQSSSRMAGRSENTAIPVPAELAGAGMTLLAAVEAGPRNDTHPGTGTAVQPPSRKKTKPASDVRSVQRVVLPGNTDAGWAARYYLEWLGSILKPLVRIDHDGGNRYRVCLRASRCAILELTYLPERSSAASSIYRISGGVLTKQDKSCLSRLEFLQIPGSRECLIAIHDYLPSLPWFLYKHTQARVHLLVMAAFRRHLLRMSKRIYDVCGGSQPSGIRDI